MYDRGHSQIMAAAAISIIVLANDAVATGSKARPNFVIFFAGDVCQQVMDVIVEISQLFMPCFEHNTY